MSTFIDLTGQTFGRWTVLSKASEKYLGNYKWVCVCNCGTTKEVIAGSLRRGKSKSCGCLISDTMKARYKHGRAVSTKKCKLNRYGLTIKEYDDMYLEQNGVCAICSKEESSIVRGTISALSVDHDHKTGIVRGLLCGDCNRALGLFRDNPELLTNAANYLKNGANVVDKDI